MIHLAVAALALAAPPRPNPEPMQLCEIRTQAWCLVHGGTRFDIKTVDNSTRIWALRDCKLGATTIRVIESRGCSSYPSDIQTKSEGVGASTVDGVKKYIISWKLHRDNSCTLFIEVPLINGDKDPIAYEILLSGLLACTAEGCF